MIDSIQIALSGMVGYQRGLDVISNNVSNMNTSGFRGSSVDFADLFGGSSQNELTEDTTHTLMGYGVDSSRTVVDDKAGTPQTTDSGLDLSLQGSGYFIVQDPSGAIRYTRDGNFGVVDGNLLMVGQPTKVMGFDANGQLTPISISNLQQSAGKPTSTVKFSQVLSPNDQTFTVDSVPVVDKLGASHTVKFVFTQDTSTGTGTNVLTWDVAVFEGNSQVGTGTLQFISQQAPTEPLSMTLSLSNSQSLGVSLDFQDVSGQIGTTGTSGSSPASTLAFESQDGTATGTLSSETFDDKGVMQLTYSNGQTMAGPTLALAELPDENGLVQLGNSLFEYDSTKPATVRKAGDDLKVQANSLEGSNVDLTTEFSALILMQRGYQAASEVVSTANEMLQQLIDMRSGK